MIYVFSAYALARPWMGMAIHITVMHAAGMIVTIQIPAPMKPAIVRTKQ